MMHMSMTALPATVYLELNAGFSFSVKINVDIFCTHFFFRLYVT